MIPVRNIYYLLCYAWDHVGDGETVDVGEEDFGGLVDLFAKVLNEGVARLIAQGLDREYLEVHEDIRGIRGKLDFSTTIKRSLLPNGRAHCSFDELSHDVPHNRILKATLRALVAVPSLDSDKRARAAELHRRLDTVSDVPLSGTLFRSVRIHRNNRFYGFLLQVCRVIHDNLLVNEDDGAAEFRDFRNDDAQMGRLFERFVRTFARRETGYAVSAPQMVWSGAEQSAIARDRLPRMQTDLVLQSHDRTVVVDTKFSKEPLSTRWGGRRARSGHLYQIFSYVTNWAEQHHSGPQPEGWLLYAAVDGDFDYRFELLGRPVRVCSIDLGRHWTDIEERLKALLADGSPVLG